MVVTLADPVKPRSRRHEFAIATVAFLALVQLSAHVLMGRKVDPGWGRDCDSAGASSPICAETLLFRDWQAAAERDGPEQWLEPLAMPHDDDANVDKPWSFIDVPKHAPPNSTSEVAPEPTAAANGAAVISDKILQALHNDSHADVGNVSSGDAHPSADSAGASSLGPTATADAKEAEDVDPALPKSPAETAPEAAADAEEAEEADPAPPSSTAEIAPEAAADAMISDEVLEATELHWDDVATWSSASTTTTQLRGSRAAIVVAHADEMSNSQWTGKKPSVACVTMVTSGPNATSQLKELVMSFKAQDYKGPKQLVLVHHRYDKDAQKLAWNAARNANRSPGAPVKAVAAMVKAGEQDTVAYRYGAWSAQADVIARYDLQAWHHPSRLSTQMKALALAKRPVSRLPSVHAPQEAGETSLVGEKAWMEKNWQPLRADESSILLHDSAVHIVHVDVPDLLAY